MLFISLDFIYFALYKPKHSLYKMKKLLAAISVIILVAVLLASCTTNSKCAAYGGDRQRYQIERR
jgi:hypothetical protein